MQTRRGIKRIELDHADFLPRLDPPEGYVVILEDVEFGRYRFMRAPTVDRPRIESGAEFPFEVTVALIFQADNAAAAELDLRDQFVSRGDIGEWFDLDASQRADLDQIGHPEPVTLRHLALPESETSSLLRDSKIVSTKPQSRTRVLPRERKRPLRRLRTLLLIVLLAAITAFVAYLGHLFVGDQDYLSALLPATATATNTARPSGPTVVIPTTSATESDSPTEAPTEIEGKGEVFYTAVRARARSCTTRDCYTLEMLEPGTKIESLGYYLGQRIDGSDRWIQILPRRLLSLRSQQHTLTSAAAHRRAKHNAATDGNCASFGDASPGQHRLTDPVPATDHRRYSRIRANINQRQADSVCRRQRDLYCPNEG